jgi:uncharacterized lipoprotein YehR (DUF1307 family)
VLKRLVLKNLVLVSLLGAAFTGCGQSEDSIPYKGGQGSSKMPKELNERIAFLSKSVVNTSTSSSRAIRQETIGLNIDINYTDKNRENAAVMVTVSYSQAAGTCSQAIYKAKDVVTTKWKDLSIIADFEDFGTAQCIDFKEGRCKYLFLTITQTPSSLANAKSGIIPAAVFVVMENKSTSPMVDKFIPMISENEKLLQVPQSEKDFQYCMKPQQLLIEDSMDVLYVVDPLSGLDLNQYNIRNDFDFSNGFF